MTSPIETKVYRDPKEFLAACGSLMSSDPVKNSLPLSLISRHISDPQQPPPSLMLVGQQNGKAIYFAFQTSTVFPFLFGVDESMRSKATEALFSYLFENKLSSNISEVISLKEDAYFFAQLWNQSHSLKMTLLRDQRLFKLTKVEPQYLTPRPNERLVQASMKDYELIEKWTFDFENEIGGPPPSETKREQMKFQLRIRVNEGRCFLWHVDNKPVSLAVYNRETPVSGNIGPVYTPKEYRNKGYATYCVAALSQKILDSGKTCATLMTDLANPISNSIYQKIGYKSVCDLAHFFIPNTPSR